MTRSYQDIIRFSRPVSAHPKMPLCNRAKIFAPFSALRGFEIELLTKERDKILLSKSTPTEQMEQEIDENLRGLQFGDTVRVTWFRPYKTLNGQNLGSYITETGIFHGMDLDSRMLRLSDHDVPIDDLRAVERVEHIVPLTV